MKFAKSNFEHVVCNPAGLETTADNLHKANFRALMEVLVEDLLIQHLDDLRCLYFELWVLKSAEFTCYADALGDQLDTIRGTSRETA